MKIISYAMVETLISRGTEKPLYIYIYTYIVGTFYIKEDMYSYFYMQEHCKMTLTWSVTSMSHLGLDS